MSPFYSFHIVASSFVSCPHYKELTPLLFPHRSDCVHCPAELRQPVESWPSQTPAWNWSAVNSHFKQPPTSYFCHLIFLCYFIWFVFKSYFLWLLPHGSISMYFFVMHWNPKWSIPWVQSGQLHFQLPQDVLVCLGLVWGHVNPEPPKRQIMNL